MRIRSLAAATFASLRLALAFAILLIVAGVDAAAAPVGVLASVFALAPDATYSKYWQQNIVQRYNMTYFLPAFTFAMHELVYFLAYLPYFIADNIAFFRRYRVQPDATSDGSKNGPDAHGSDAQWRCLSGLLKLHFLVELPLMIVSGPIMEWLGMDTHGPLHSLPSYLAFVVVSAVLEDFYFYWVHRGLHHPRVYKYVHKVHHEHKAPFGIAAEYAHPAETICLGIGTALGPLIFAPYVHITHLWLWVAFRLLQTVDVHSGFDFPWHPTRFLPMVITAKFHDFHHMATDKGNYSSYFTWCDRVFGSDVCWQNALKIEASGKSWTQAAKEAAMASSVAAKASKTN